MVRSRCFRYKNVSLHCLRCINCLPIPVLFDWRMYLCKEVRRNREVTSSTKSRSACSWWNENTTVFYDEDILKTRFRNNAMGRAWTEHIFPPSAGDIGEILSPMRCCATAREGRNNNRKKKWQKDRKTVPFDPEGIISHDVYNILYWIYCRPDVSPPPPPPRLLRSRPRRDAQ